MTSLGPEHRNPVREPLPDPLEQGRWTWPDLVTKVTCDGCRTDLEAAASTMGPAQLIGRSIEAVLRATLNVTACAAAGHPRLLTDPGVTT